MKTGKESTKESDFAHAPPRFPGTRPKPHEIKIYFDALVECIAKNKLSNTADGKLPSRVAHLIKYPENMAEEPPPLARTATDSDRRDHERESSRRFDRRRENSEIDLKKAVAVRDDESLLFTLITDSMKETNPGLRDNLRETYKVSGAPGHFTGSTALAKIRADLAAQVAEGTYDKFYEEALRWQEANRLKEGCTPTEFSARTRTFVHYTNPFLRRPYKGSAIGKFIIETILPAAYNEAGDRILGDCEKDSCLSDAVEVERRCLQKVAKCQKASSKAVVAAHGTPYNYDGTGGNDGDTGDHETLSLIAAMKQTLTEKSWGLIPCDDSILKARDEALAQEPGTASKELVEKYGSLTGALRYVVEERPDVAVAVGVLEEARHNPTDDLYERGIRQVVYLGRTIGQKLHYRNFVARAYELVQRVDSDWSHRRSRTGHVTKLAGASIHSRSHRQHSISLSSCEAELQALADAGMDLVYVIQILSHLGYEFEALHPKIEMSDPEAHGLYSEMRAKFRLGAIEVGTDSKSAHDLCHREGAGPNSRHIMRKTFKMRQLRGAGIADVILVPGKENEADILTKPLDAATFIRHRQSILGMPSTDA